ncbi:MAG: type II toxin-antitoxin system prevent-host-death family antitoxin [Chloroflexota bacterium]|nr:type II toxin-antitoxin system prevent-host-death family antitoxin [Chloroflexota bacterium]
MRTIGAYEAKTHLPRLLDEVAAGETITITKHGVPVAKLVPPDGAKPADVGRVIDEWREFRKRHKITLDGLSIREMIEEGRRY